MSVTPVGVDGAIAGDGKRNDVVIVDRGCCEFCGFGRGEAGAFFHASWCARGIKRLEKRLERGVSHHGSR